MKYGKMIYEIEKCIEDGEYSKGEKWQNGLLFKNLSRRFSII